MLDELAAVEFGATFSVSPHEHRAHVDSFFVLDDGFTFEFAGEATTLPAGSFVLAPPHLVHAFREGTSRVLNMHAPGRAWARTRVGRREGRRGAPDEIDTYDPPDNGGLPGSAAVVVRPGEGELLERDDRRIRILAARPELCVFAFDADPGYTGPGPHFHEQHVDAFYVLEGELAFELDGERVPAPAGTWVAATQGVVHTFRNARDEPVRFVNVHAPGLRFDEYLRRQDAGEDGREFHESFDVYERPKPSDSVPR
jgi:mannose-6-phosphate isomerase-like protein (cupin superfamily)